MTKLSIEIGGKLPLSKLPVLADLLEAAGCNEDMCAGTGASNAEMVEILEGYHDPENQYSMELFIDEDDYDPDAVLAITSYCVEQGLSLKLDYYEDSDTEAMLEIFLPGQSVRCVWLGHNDDAVLTSKQLTDLAKAGGTIQDAIAALSVPEIPAFEIYG